LAVPPDFIFTRHTLSKFFPDIYNRSYMESRRIDITGAGAFNSSLDFSFGGILRKIYVATSGSFDGDYFDISGSNRTQPYGTNIFIPPNNLGFVFPIEVGERFTGSNNSVYFTFRPTGSFTNKVYWYALFVRD